MGASDTDPHAARPESLHICTSMPRCCRSLDHLLMAVSSSELEHRRTSPWRFSEMQSSYRLVGEAKNICLFDDASVRKRSASPGPARLARVVATDGAQHVTQRAKGVNYSSLDAGGNIPSVPGLSSARGKKGKCSRIRSQATMTRLAEFFPPHRQAG